MSTRKKTREQKIRADLRRQQIQQTAPQNLYSYTSQKEEQGIIAQKTIQSTVINTQDLNNHLYQDLFKTVVLTVCIVIAELLFYFSIYNR